MAFDLVGVGNPVYDEIVTPWVATEGRVLSGCSVNACLASKRLGLSDVGVIGCIGRDFAHRFMRDMNRYGITASMNSGSKQTGGFHLVYDKDGNRTLTVLGVADKITPTDIPDDFLKSKFFLIGPILGEIDVSLLEFIRSSSKAKIMLDPQGLLRLIGENGMIVHRCEENIFRRVAELVDFIKPNEYEGEVITGYKSPKEVIGRLKDLGFARPLLTLAERGSILLDGSALYRVPAFTTKAIDPTGAGDVYAGSFIAELERTNRLLDSATLASAAASLKVEQVGPNFILPREIVLERKRILSRGVVMGEMP